MEIERKYRIDRFPGEEEGWPLVKEAVVCQGYIATSPTVRIRAAEARGGVLVGVGAIVDRSGGRAAFGVPFRALLALEVPHYPEEACPLCREGVPLEEV